MRSFHTRLVALAAAICAAAAGCDRDEILSIQDLDGNGQPFTNALTHEYKQFVLEEEVKYLDLFRARPYVDKASRAAEGEIVLPEDPGRRIPSDQSANLRQAHNRLIKALDDDGRDKVPAVAAKAQVKYDCWLERTDAGLRAGEIAECRRAFVRSLDLVEEATMPIDTGTAFTRHATREYLAYSYFDAEQQRDYIDSRHFAAKAAASRAGTIVLPEDLMRWNLTLDETPEFLRARTRLIRALDAGGREIAPKASAVAQVNFDCWVERTAEREEVALTESCRANFEEALAEVERALGIGAGLPREDLVAYFEFDRADIRPDAAEVVRDAIEAVRLLKPANVTVVGHADRAGSVAYNLDLSLRRAEAVRREMIRAGLDPGLITPIARGEREPAVATEDGVPHPLNRRVQIILQ